MPCFFCSWFKSQFQSLGPRTTQQILFGLTEYYLLRSYSKSCRIPMRYFSQTVSKSCWRSISFYFTFVNIDLVLIFIPKIIFDILVWFRFWDYFNPSITLLTIYAICDTISAIMTSELGLKLQNLWNMHLEVNIFTSKFI